jgi:antitoxin (DNA-binding transcriptional repressor) of toxin-antitoxin stability system
MHVSQVRCREIVEHDIDAIGDLLTRGFPGRTRDYWMRGLRRQSERSVPDGYPRYGYLLENDNRPVGVLLLLYSSRAEAGKTTIRCNVSSWYVEPAFRVYAALLNSKAQKDQHVTYINISPAVPTWPIIEAQGYKLYCSGLFFSLPVLSRAEAGAGIEIVTPETRSIAKLPPADLELLVSQAQYGCLALVCHTTDSPLPFVMAPKRIRAGRIPLAALQLIYCRETADFVSCAGAIGRFLMRRGKPVVILDANGPVAGLAGIYSETRGRKYFKGPNPPRLTDLTETELVLYGS